MGITRNDERRQQKRPKEDMAIRRRTAKKHQGRGSKEKKDQCAERRSRRQTTRNQQLAKERQTPEDQQFMIEGRRWTPGVQQLVKEEGGGPQRTRYSLGNQSRTQRPSKAVETTTTQPVTNKKQLKHKGVS